MLRTLRTEHMSDISNVSSSLCYVARISRNVCDGKARIKNNLIQKQVNKVSQFCVLFSIPPECGGVVFVCWTLKYILSQNLTLLI